jgi:uncharacterized protein YukE
MDLDTAARPVGVSPSAIIVPTTGLDRANGDTSGGVPGVSRAGATGSDGFEIDIPVVAGVAGIFAAESTSLGELAASLQARLAQHGACWGDDVVGARFGAAYGPAAATVAANVAALSAGLERISAALRAVADNYATADGLFTTLPVMP